MENQLIIPQEWHPEDDYSSHRPMLYLALKHTKKSVIELGCGAGSTELLRNFCSSEGRQFNSYDNNKEWAEKYNAGYVENWINVVYWPFCDLLFIDLAPGGDRKEAISRMTSRAQIIVIHDTETGAEYVYGLSRVLSTFKYRLDLHIPGMPSTTAVSNFIDVGQWKGEYSGFKFV